MKRNITIASAKRIKKPTNKSRKATLLHIIEGLGNYPGIEVFRSPGEDCAVAIAIAIIKHTPTAYIDKLSAHVKDADWFWQKSW